MASSTEMHTISRFAKIPFIGKQPLGNSPNGYYALTDVGCDYGEGVQVRLAHVLGQSAGVIFKILEQLCRATL